MPFLPCKFSRNEVNKAGTILCTDFASFDIGDFVWAMDVLNSWRASHSYPINTFQANLRTKLKTLKIHGFIAQRLKRVSSIISKLERQEKMQLARMQDIGGLRAVVRNVASVRRLRDALVKSRFTHQLVKENDYITKPKGSGYRSVHLVYRYNSKIISAYNNHLLEIQIRTQLQHSWATSVETMGTFLNQSLKSSEGSEQWLEFFAVASSAFAIIEKSPIVSQFSLLSDEETFSEVRKQAKALDVVKKLSTFGLAVKSVTEAPKSSDYFLLVLKPEEKLVQITGYDRRNLKAATEHYLDEEKLAARTGKTQVVLVKAESVDALRKAYPNYFLDTHGFIEVLSTIIDGKKG